MGLIIMICVISISVNEFVCYVHVPVREITPYPSCLFKAIDSFPFISKYYV